MKIRLTQLLLSCKESVEVIDFVDFNYFHGQMGSGKSSIARLIDYCFGGSLDMTPALQSEFVSAQLSLTVASKPVTLVRDRGANQIRCVWMEKKGPFEIVLPARKADGEVLKGTGVEVLSDLIFYLAGQKPPKVRRSKWDEDSDLGRLSFRDLLWYCYLDQDSMDSSFFNLDPDGNQFKRWKSRDVLRFVIGFHQEEVARLESELEDARTRRIECESGVQALKEVLRSESIATEIELSVFRGYLEEQIQLNEVEIQNRREDTRKLQPSGVSLLKQRNRSLNAEIQNLESTIRDLEATIAKDNAHFNELVALSVRHLRLHSAREVLAGVDFLKCPRCDKQLPPRNENLCPVCGQIHDAKPHGALDEATMDQDLAARKEDLNELIQLQERQLSKAKKIMNERLVLSERNEIELQSAMERYDSAYLSAALELERKNAALHQQLLDLQNIEAIIGKVSGLEAEAATMRVKEQNLRSQLREQRERAERDTKNLAKLKELFLSSLLRAKIHGFADDDTVEIKSPEFLPEVFSQQSGELATTSYATLGSGGKKTLFKCCFAIAMQVLARNIGATLPTLLIIDSPMKNISERENRRQFEGFHELLFELSENELKDVQFILIDKEYLAPGKSYGREFFGRQMNPDDPKNPPLIRYYPKVR